MLVQNAIQRLKENIKEGDSNYEALHTVLSMYQKLETMVEELNEERKETEDALNKCEDICENYKETLTKLQKENEELRATNKVLEEKLLNSNSLVKDIKDTMVKEKTGKSKNDIFQTAFNAAMGALRDMDSKK